MGYLIGRVYIVHPSNFQCYFLPLPLYVAKVPAHFKALTTVNGWVCKTFREACFTLGLLKDDANWNTTPPQAEVSQLDPLLAIMLYTCDLTNHTQLWESHKQSMAEDVVYRYLLDGPTDIKIYLSEDMLNKALNETVHTVLLLGGKQLQEIGLPNTNWHTQLSIAQESVREISENAD